MPGPLTVPIPDDVIRSNPLIPQMMAQQQAQQAQPQVPALSQGPPPPTEHVLHTHTLGDVPQGPDLGTSVPGTPPLQNTPMPKPLAKIAPPAPSPYEQGLAGEQARLAKTGSGISQIKNPVGRGLLTALDAVGSGLFPRIAMNIPGTEAHHEALLMGTGGALEKAQQERHRESQEQLEAAKAEHQIETENKATKPDIHAIYAAAVEDAMKRGVDPKEDPAAQQALEALTATTAKEPKEPQSNEALLAELIREEQKAGRDPSQNPKYGQLLNAIHATQKPPAEKEGEMPIGDERAASTNASTAALYKGAGLPVPSYAQLTGKHTQKDEARIVDSAKAEIAQQRMNQEFQQREKDRQTQMAVNQSNRADTQLNRSQDNFNKNMNAELKPLQEQLDNAAEARRLINGGSVQQFLGTVKTLVATAGGRGSGVRITQAELNGIPSARGVAGGFEGFVNSLSGKGKLSSDQVRQVNQALGEIEQLARAKQERVNKYMDQAVTARSPTDIRKIEQDYRHEQMQANQPQGGGGGARPTATDAKGNKVEWDGKAWVPQR